MLERILSAEHISKTFVDRGGARVVAFEDISLSVARKEFVSIIGPSGCGKSTFLRIVAGLDRPTTGEIRVAEKIVTGPGADRGMVFQEYALFPWKTTQDNVEFGLRLKGVARDERARVARHFLEVVGLAGFEDKYPHQLSGGMRQRAAVARALANNPTILLMDEPFAAVDAMTRQRLQEELTALTVSEETTVLFVTHAVDEAIFLSDRIIVFSRHPGRVISEITIDFARPRTWADVLHTERFNAYREELIRLTQGGADGLTQRDAATDAVESRH